MNEAFLANASPEARALIQSMKPACHTCPKLQRGACDKFNGAAGDDTTAATEALTLIRENVAVNPEKTGCAAPAPKSF